MADYNKHIEHVQAEIDARNKRLLAVCRQIWECDAYVSCESVTSLSDAGCESCVSVRWAHIFDTGSTLQRYRFLRNVWVSEVSFHAVGCHLTMEEAALHALKARNLQRMQR